VACELQEFSHCLTKPWIEFMWLRTGPVAGFVNMAMNLRVP
jgi:hypothetical protein